MGSMNDQVFLSYANEDAVIARRIHQALARTRLPVWGYKEDSRLGVDFRQEFREQIRLSRFFCLLDSRYSRASAWIKTECELAQEVGAVRVICRVETVPLGEEPSVAELLKDQNFIMAIDLTDFNPGIRRLCRHLGIAYSPGFGLPRDQDFEREVFESGLDDVNRVQELNDLYRDFRENYADSEFAEAQLRVVIKKCQRYGATNIVSPVLALGVMLADASRHRGALNIFKGLTESHPRDPRGWAGLGGACFHLGEYESALAALQSSRSMIRRFYPKESAERLPEVLHNIASVLSLLGRQTEAWAILNELSPGERHDSYIDALQGRILLAENSPARALPFLERAYEDFLQRYDVPPPLVLNLADCYRKLGRNAEESALVLASLKMLPNNPEISHRAADYFLRNGRSGEAMAALRSATASLPESPVYRAQLAALLQETGKEDEAVIHALECVRSGLTHQERYFRGLAYFLLGKREIADYEFEACRGHDVVTEWPHYSELLTRESRKSFRRIVSAIAGNSRRGGD